MKNAFGFVVDLDFVDCRHASAGGAEAAPVGGGDWQGAGQLRCHGFPVNLSMRHDFDFE